MAVFLFTFIPTLFYCPYPLLASIWQKHTIFLYCLSFGITALCFSLERKRAKIQGEFPSFITTYNQSQLPQKHSFLNITKKKKETGQIW